MQGTTKQSTSRFRRQQVWLLLAVFVASFVLVSTPSQAQDSEAVTSYLSGFKNASTYIRKQDFAAGLKEIDEVIAKVGEGAIDSVGPIFGHLYYLKGVCHANLDQVDEAITAFRTCTETYKNIPEKVAKTQRPNGYIGKARAQLGAAYMVRGDFKAAVTTLEQAMKDGGNNRGDVSLNFAKSLVKTGDARGKRMLQNTITNKDAPSASRLESLLILCEDWAFETPTEEIVPFFGQYRSHIATIPQHLRLRGNQRLHRLARNSLAQQDSEKALLWFSLLQDPDRALDAYRHRLAEFRAMKDEQETLKSRIKLLEDEIGSQEELAEAVQIDRAATYLSATDYPGAQAVYRFLVDHRKDLEARPTLLHNLLVCDIQRANYADAATHAAVFFDEYPEHEVLPDVARMYSDALFAKGDFNDCFAVATEKRGAFEVGSDRREPLDYNVAASLFQMGRFEDAEAEFDKFIETYPAGARLHNALFFQGATKVERRNWDAGARILDTYCQNYPDGNLRPTALYLSALSYLQSDLLDEALVRATEITEKYPASPEVAVAHNIRGDVLIGIGEAPIKEIKECFSSGKAAAEANSDAPAAAYALWQLVGLASFEERWEDVGTLFNEFQDKYPDSPFHVELLVASLTGLGQIDRAHQAIDLLEKAILQYGTSAVSPELSELFGTYAAYLREQIPALEVLDRLDEFPGPDPLPLPIQGWLEMAKVETKDIIQPRPPQKEINTHFYRMKIEVERPNLANYCLLKLARWESEVRKKPEDAREHYKFLVDERKGQAGYEFALFDIAVLDAESEEEPVRREALNRMEELLKDYEAPELVEAATVEIGRLHVSLGQWNEAKDWWESYLRNRSWSSARAEANYNVARAAEEAGNQGEALKLFVSVYVNFPGQLRWSTDAYIRSAKILKAQGKDEKALLVLRDMIVRMRKMEHPAVEEALDLFLKWRTEYELKLKAQKNA